MYDSAAPRFRLLAVLTLVVIISLTAGAFSPTSPSASAFTSGARKPEQQQQKDEQNPQLFSHSTGSSITTSLSPLPKRVPLATSIPPLNCTPRRYSSVEAVPRFTRKDAEVRPRIAILTISAILDPPGTVQFDHFAARRHYSFYNKLQYANKWGYDFIMEGRGILGDSSNSKNSSRHPAFAKIAALRKWLPKYDIVVYFDDDVLFMNWQWRIEDAFPLNGTLQTSELRKVGSKRSYVPVVKRREDLLCCVDFQNVNSGVMFLRRGDWAMQFLERVDAVTAREADHKFFEQDSVAYRLGVLKKERIRIPPNITEVKEDRAHTRISSICPWNTLPASTLQRHFGFLRKSQWRDLRNQDRIYRPGHAAVHFFACRDHCLDWFKHHYELALCQNDGMDAPLDKNNGVPVLPFESYMPPD